MGAHCTNTVPTVSCWERPLVLPSGVPPPARSLLACVVRGWGALAAPPGLCVPIAVLAVPPPCCAFPAADAAPAPAPGTAPAPAPAPAPAAIPALLRCIFIPAASCPTSPISVNIVALEVVACVRHSAHDHEHSQVGGAWGILRSRGTRNSFNLLQVRRCSTQAVRRSAQLLGVCKQRRGLRRQSHGLRFERRRLGLDNSMGLGTRRGWWCRRGSFHHHTVGLLCKATKHGVDVARPIVPSSGGHTELLACGGHTTACGVANAGPRCASCCTKPWAEL